ncbi:unnamed protein product [Triticum turgidum subsp. durum]|uniref:HHO5-like N-terminal domain-containing protein n=1 Tax=Triticum turgidum subsp. durum TaxID=4567 RepID=A0A9R0RH35_TRITD|nr:unnamed protein product [Triticum turgidum subsp. durum]
MAISKSSSSSSMSPDKDSSKNISLNISINTMQHSRSNLIAKTGKHNETRQKMHLVNSSNTFRAKEATTQKLQEFLARLDDERLKIDAFKRELPLCMQLLNQAMEAYRQQLEACQMGSHGGAAARAPLVLEEFIPLKNIGIDAAEKAAGNAPSEKANWMIRELMKVDGLTNDEVKSHLQKYRLHTRRPMPAPSAPPPGAPQLVVLGGIWMPPDYAAQGAGPAGIYGAHPATQAHYTAAVSAQEYYQNAAAAAHHGHHMQHHQAASMVHHRAVAPPPPQPAYKVHPLSAAGSQASSEGRRSSGGGRERSESIEEEGEEREDEEDEDEDGMAANGDAEQINY